MLLLEQLRIKIEEETKIASETQCSESLQDPGKLLRDILLSREGRFCATGSFTMFITQTVS